MLPLCNKTAFKLGLDESINSLQFSLSSNRQQTENLLTKIDKTKTEN